jgi:hypothetical protein
MVRLKQQQLHDIRLMLARPISSPDEGGPNGYTGSLDLPPRTPESSYGPVAEVAPAPGALLVSRVAPGPPA